MTIVAQLVPEETRATALAIRLTGNRVGQIAAPASAGLLAGGAGTASVFWLMSALLLASGIVITRRIGKHDGGTDERCDIAGDTDLSESNGDRGERTSAQKR